MVVLGRVNTSLNVLNANFLAVFGPVRYCVRTACAVSLESVYAAVIRGVMT